MLKYKHVLLATCLTSASQKVAVRAHDIAMQCGAKLSIIHVLEQVAAAYGGEFSTAIDVEYEQQLELNIQKALNNLASEYNIPQEQRHFETGSIKHSVVDLAKNENVDLIVVGSHSHHGLQRLLGSKANAILHAAGCDVLAVRVKDE